MIKKTLLVALVALVAQPALAEWQANIYHDNGFDLPYQLFTPEKNGQSPLIIHLHGTGEAGTDNKAQMYLKYQLGPAIFCK
jgi:predicted peptidase